MEKKRTQLIAKYQQLASTENMILGHIDNFFRNSFGIESVLFYADMKDMHQILLTLIEELERKKLFLQREIADSFLQDD